MTESVSRNIGIGLDPISNKYRQYTKILVRGTRYDLINKLLSVFGKNKEGMPSTILSEYSENEFHSLMIFDIPRRHPYSIDFRVLAPGHEPLFYEMLFSRLGFVVIPEYDTKDYSNFRDSFYLPYRISRCVSHPPLINSVSTKKTDPEFIHIDCLPGRIWELSDSRRIGTLPLYYQSEENGLDRQPFPKDHRSAKDWLTLFHGSIVSDDYRTSFIETSNSEVEMEIGEKIIIPFNYAWLDAETAIHRETDILIDCEWKSDHEIQGMIAWPIIPSSYASFFTWVAQQRNDGTFNATNKKYMIVNYDRNEWWCQTGVQCEFMSFTLILTQSGRKFIEDRDPNNSAVNAFSMLFDEYRKQCGHY